MFENTLFLFYFFVEADMAKESEFQAKLIREIKLIFPDCIVLKNDPTYLQGMPDILILCKDKWAALECKRSSSSSHRPNQDYYISRLNEMSFASFIFPENKEIVLHELQQTFESSGDARVSECK